MDGYPVASASASNSPEKEDVREGKAAKIKAVVEGERTAEDEEEEVRLPAKNQLRIFTDASIVGNKNRWGVKGFFLKEVYV